MTRKLDPETKARKVRVLEMYQRRKEMFSTERVWCISAQFTLPDGQRVVGEFDLRGYSWPPREELAKVYEALSRGPLHMTGRRGRPSRQRAPEEPPQS